MKSQTNQTESKSEVKDTISMTVVISKEAREKLRDAKGILGCKTLDDAVTSMTGIISIKDLLAKRLAKENSKESLSVSGAIPTQSDPIATNTSTTDEERDMIFFCKKLLIDLKLEDMKELTTYIDSDIVIIENKLLPKRSPVGEIPEDIEWEEE